MFKWFFTSLLFLLSLCCHAQSLELKFDHLTSADGLPQNGIFGITKDKYGFMWFGTWSGLCRYDGYRFKIYRAQPGQLRSIVNSRIMNIIKDTSHQIWILTANDSIVCKYNYMTDDFERFNVRKVPKDIMEKLSWENSRTNSSIIKNNYLWKIDSRNDRLSQTFLPSGSEKQYVSNPIKPWSINDSFVTSIYLDDQNIFWAGTFSDGINKANLAAKPFYSFHHTPDDRNTIIDNHVRTLAADQLGNLWVGTRAKGITIVSPNKSHRHLNSKPGAMGKISNDHIKMLYCDSRGKVWIGMLHGLNSYDTKTGILRHFNHKGLNDASVFAAMEDHQANLWFATWSGIYRFSQKTDSVVRFDTQRTMKSQKAMAILEDRYHRIWVGTEGGGISVFLKPGISQDLKLYKQFSHTTDNDNSISDNRIYSIYEDLEGFIWIGTGNGVDRYNPSTQTFKHLVASAKGLGSATIAAITEDRNGYLWVSHKKGISQIDKKTFTVRNYSTQDGLLSSEFSDGAVFNDRRKGTLYFGGNNGYTTFHPDSIKTDHTLPKVILTELQILNKSLRVNDTVNGRILLKKPLYLTETIELNYKDKSIAIEFAGLHYANPSENKYAYMLEGFDKDWIYTDASNRIATYSNLSRGKYLFKVKASNSDGVWNAVPASLNLTVSPPWWTTITAYIVYILILAIALYIVFYYSLRYDRLKMKLTYESLFNQKELELRQNKIEFFTNISHEIKTPLSLILAPVERLMTNHDDKSFVAAQLFTMKKNGDRLLKLINQLLDFRKLEAGHDKLLIEQDDLIKFIHRIVESFRQLAFERGIVLEFQHEDTVLHTGFDHDKLEKVMYNLLSNSFKFTKPGGQIIVRLLKQDMEGTDWVAIEIVDDGELIPKEEFERIFTPFKQASTNKTNGTGLGLAYAKKLITLQGGTISVESDRLRSGEINTCFRITIPFQHSNKKSKTDLRYEETFGMTENASVRIENKNTELRQLPHDKKLPLLLFVEDNHELRIYLKNYFELAYRIIEASNGKEGLLIARQYCPDLILSDMMMPEMDGLEMCMCLKREILTSHIPVILLTAKSTVESEIAGIETGADDYLTKPFNLKLLSAKIKNLLDLRIKLRDKYKKNLYLESKGEMPISPDEKLLKKILNFVEERLADTELSVDHICNTIGLSKTQLYRKITALTGMSTVDLIKKIRLERAGTLLSAKKFNVNEVSFMVGFADTDYFRKCFKIHFGLSPSEFIKKNTNSAVNHDRPEPSSKSI